MKGKLSGLMVLNAGLATVVLTLILVAALSRLPIHGKLAGTVPLIPSAAIPPPPPRPLTPLQRFAKRLGLRSVSSDVVFVTRDIYGGDLVYSASLRGKLRNISGQPYQNVLVLWMFYDANVPFLVYVNASPEPSVFVQRIEYLDSKAEADFAITLDFYSRMASDSADKVRWAIREGRQEAGLFVSAGPGS